MPAGTGAMPRGGVPKGEKVPIGQPWKMSDEENMRNNGVPHRNCWHTFFGWMKMSFIPGFIFMATSAVFMVGYHQNPKILLGLACFFILALLSDSAYQHRRAGQMSKNSFGFMTCAFAVAAGALLGTSIHLTELLDYWPYYQKRHYTNVAPDEPAASKGDASVIVFMEGARPDGSREIGYRRNGNTYCVAPISVSADVADATGAAPATNIQYWAVGQNCCGGHDGFTCDDAGNEKARSGLVLQKLTGPDRYLSIMSSDALSYYAKAVKMSITKFDLTSPDEPLFVRFVQDIDKARSSYWDVAWKSWWIYQFCWLFVWIPAGAVAMLLAAGDKNDPDNYNEHIIDARQSGLFALNHYI